MGDGDGMCDAARTLLLLLLLLLLLFPAPAPADGGGGDNNCDAGAEYDACNSVCVGHYAVQFRRSKQKLRLFGASQSIREQRLSRTPQLPSALRLSPPSFSWHQTL
jgi:hypothetical protein